MGKIVKVSKCEDPDQFCSVGTCYRFATWAVTREHTRKYGGVEKAVQRTAYYCDHHAEKSGIREEM